MGTYASTPFTDVASRLGDYRPIGRHPDDDDGPCYEALIERAECDIWSGSVLNLVEMLEDPRHAAQQRADHAALLDILDRTARHYVESGKLTERLERERWPA